MILRAHCRKPIASLLALLVLACAPAIAQDADDDSDNSELSEEELTEIDELIEQDDTADIDTDSTNDRRTDERGLRFSGDFRPLLNHLDRTNRSDEDLIETTAQARIRFRGGARLSDLIGVGARIAGRCASDDCDLEWVYDRATPQTNGLEFGQFTFDEFYVHLFQADRFDLTLGRQQTRSVLRGGVFSRSLDRNDSNNTNVTWTDGAHFTLRQRRSWEGHIIVQHNAADGSGSIRRGQLDFEASSARTSYYISTENRSPLGPIVQRSFSISYLPNSLLKDGVPDGRRETYMGFVGRMAFRWPQRTEGPRLRAGFEVGYAPEVPTSEGANIDADVDGLAWNVTFSLMEFKPRNNIGVYYSRTGAGWLLSPNLVHNEESFEIRYQWRPRNRAAIDFRVRWREDLEQQTTAVRKRERFDAFLRLTWQFDL